jgi:hypothetical protein
MVSARILTESEDRSPVSSHGLEAGQQVWGWEKGNRMSRMCDAIAPREVEA